METIVERHDDVVRSGGDNGNTERDQYPNTWVGSYIPRWRPSPAHPATVDRIMQPRNGTENDVATIRRSRNATPHFCF